MLLQHNIRYLPAAFNKYALNIVWEKTTNELVWMIHAEVMQTQVTYQR